VISVTTERFGPTLQDGLPREKSGAYVDVYYPAGQQLSGFSLNETLRLEAMKRFAWGAKNMAF